MHPARPRSTGPPVALPGRLYGVRVWPLTVDAGGELRLGRDGRRWRSDGKSTWAVCEARRPPHPAGAASPAGNCTCGLHALHPWGAGRVHRHAPGAGLIAIGIVEAWGRIQVHAEGFRAQYARPVAISTDGAPPDSDQRRILADLAIAHRTRLLAVSSHQALLHHCHREGLGMTRRAVESLLSRAPGGDPGDDGRG